MQTVYPILLRVTEAGQHKICKFEHKTESLKRKIAVEQKSFVARINTVYLYKNILSLHPYSLFRKVFSNVYDTEFKIVK